MKKQMLKKLVKLKAKPSLLKAYKEDVPKKRRIEPSYWGKRGIRTVNHYKYYEFLQAEVENGIMKVGIWQRHDLMCGQQDPEFTVFIDKEKEEWITWQRSEGKWLTGMIFNLPYEPMEGKSFGNERYASEATRKTIAQYLETDGTAYQMIRIFQVEKKKDLLEKRHKSELEQIDEFIESVPEYPAGYNNEWLVKSGFMNRANIVYHPGTKNGKCLRCGKEIVLKEKPKHLGTAKCPACRVSATLRSWGKQKEILERKQVGILQRVIGGTDYCLSVQEIGIRFKQDENYSNMQILKYGDYKFRLDNHFTRHEVFEWYEYRNTGVVRWCHATGHGMGYYAYRASSYCTLYEKNLKELFKDTELKYLPLTEYIRNRRFKAFNADECLNEAYYHVDDLEKLMKAGLEHLATYIMEKTYSGDFARNARKLEDLLKLDRDRMKQAVAMNVTVQQLRILQAGRMAKVNLEPDTVRELSEFYPHSTNDLYFIVQRKNLKKELNYLLKVTEQSKIEKYVVGRDYRDYLEQLDKLGLPQDKHNRFPANFYQTHEMLSEQIKEMDAQIAKMDVAKKNRKLKKIIKELEPIYTAPSKKFVIVWPKSKRDFQTEGQKQHNCVGSYFDRVVRRDTVVFFLRKKEAVDEPFCTVEFNGGKLVQCRTIYNQAAPEDARKYMEQIEKHYMEMMMKKEKMEEAM